MRTRLAEPRPSNRRNGRREGFLSAIWADVHRTSPVLKHRAAMTLAEVLVLSLATAARAEWPAPPTARIAELAKSQYWPNDPEYGCMARSATDASGQCQWWLYSFVPERTTSAPLLKQPGLASGVSVDAAWRYGTGQASTILAFLDEGYDLSSAELRESVLLNPGEIPAAQAPVHKNGSPCAPLVPNDPNSPRFDCAAPLGALTVQDFAEALGWYEGGARTDPNGNGVLDPEDIVRQYQNKKDEDGNGLADDIAGWNFVEGNPFAGRSTSSAATESALDALAKADNGIGRAGVCPGCVGLPIRVADQRGADPQRMALAILYAAARGTTAALVGHLPLGRSETLELALQNAAQRGTLVLFPRDGEQQNHAPILFDFDTWLSIGGVTTRGEVDSPRATTSFVAQDPCQSFPPGITYVGAGVSCSRRSARVVLGVAGLVASSGQLAASPARLTPMELASTLKWSADPVDTNVAATGDSSDARQSSTRRINANAAVEAAQRALIPPELNVERPLWHEPIVFDKVKTTTTIVGRYAAPRANSVSLSVSVAPGDHPSDTQFQILATKEGSTTKSSGLESSSLATLDLHDWYNSTRQDTRKTDSNGTVVTIRVSATARYDSGTLPATTTVERRVVLLRDPDLLFASPFRIGSKPTAPKLFDVDGDSFVDIIFGTLDGRLLALSARSGRLTDLFATPLYTRQSSEFETLTTKAILDGNPSIPTSAGHSPIASAPAIWDLDSDGRPEIVHASLNGWLYAVHRDGSALRGWPVQLPEVTSDCTPTVDQNRCIEASSRLERGISSSPVIADVNGDGRQDVVVAAHDGRVHAYNLEGKPIAGWPVAIGISDGTRPGRLTQSPSVGDFNQDGASDLVVTAGEERSRDAQRGTHVLILGSTTNAAPVIADNWPVSVDSSDLVVDRIDRTTPATAIDATTDSPRAILYGNSSPPFFLGLVPGSAADSSSLSFGGQLPSNAEPVSLADGRSGFRLEGAGVQSALNSATMFAPMLARPSLGDLDRDGLADVVVPGLTSMSLDALRNNSYSGRQGLLGMWSGDTGNMLPAAPIALDGFVGSAAAAIADLTNDGYPEVVIPNGGSGILALDACGRSAPGWPKLVGGAVSTSAAIGDVNNDGLLDVVVATDDGWLYVWQTKAPTTNYVAWASELNDSRNQSNLRPMDELSGAGYTEKLPLDAAGRCREPIAPQPDAPPLPILSARGGCGGCHLQSRRIPGEMATAFCAVLVVAMSIGRRIAKPRRRVN